MARDIPYDLIVLGAGPAGSAAAMAGRKHGLSVALIDKAAFPRNKLCGGLVTGRAKRIFERVFDAPLTAPLIETRDRAVFYRNGALLGEMADIPPLHLTMRWGFDDHALQLALAAGAAPYLGQRVAEIDTEGRRVALQSGPTLSYRVLIGADGVNSAVARHLFGRAFDPDTIGFALETEAPPDDLSGPVRIDFGAASYGYGWRFPKSGSTTVGVGGLHRLNPDMQAAFHAYTTPGDGKAKGHFLPFGDFRRLPGEGAVLLAGDAAGLVDPITGEGIAYAMESGALAAEAAAQAIAEGRPSRALGRYRRGLRPIHRSLRIAARLRPIIFSDRFGATFGRAFSGGGGTVRRAYMRMLAGQTEYPALLALILRRVPALVWARARRGRSRPADLRTGRR
jgi:geranylgeranyl reductase family protein